jgi:hypothetical protein
MEEGEGERVEGLVHIGLAGVDMKGSPSLRAETSVYRLGPVPFPK